MVGSSHDTALAGPGSWRELLDTARYGLVTAAVEIGLAMRSRLAPVWLFVCSVLL